MDIEEIRADFPVLERTIDDNPVVYLDSAATTLKPRSVIDAVSSYYMRLSANIHRGKHRLSEEASEAFDDARRTVAAFVGASPQQLVFVRNTTEALALAARQLHAGPDRRVLVPRSEHHSNVLPWMRAGAIEWIDPDDEGRFDPAVIERAPPKVVALSFALASNVTGAIQPAASIIAAAKRRGLAVVIDGAQAVPHIPTDFAALGCDYLAFSSHKMLGPTGIGALVATPAALESPDPLMSGGGAVKTVEDHAFELKAAPYCYEAGTPPIEAALGFGAAARYLSSLDMRVVEERSRKDAALLLDVLRDVPGVRVLGPASPGERIGLASLAFDNPRANPDDLAMVLSDSYGICVRSGTLCAHPYFRRLGVTAALRASAYVYTREEEITLFGRRLADVLRAAL